MPHQVQPEFDNKPWLHKAIKKNVFIKNNDHNYWLNPITQMYDLFKEKDKKNQIFPLFPIKVKKNPSFLITISGKNLIKVHYNTYWGCIWYAKLDFFLFEFLKSPTVYLKAKWTSPIHKINKKKWLIDYCLTSSKQHFSCVQ